MEDILQTKLRKCYAKWLCQKECKNKTCQTKKYCSNQKRYDKIRKTIENMGKEKDK